MTNWIVIGIVIIIGVLFVLPALSSGLKREGSGGTIGGGAETIPSGDVGQGGILPDEGALGGNSIDYVPGTGSNAFVPSEKIQAAITEYNRTGILGTPQLASYGGSGYAAGAGRQILYRPLTQPGQPHAVFQDVTAKQQASFGQSGLSVSPNSGSLMYRPSTQPGQPHAVFQDVGSGKSNTQNLSAPIIPIPTIKPQGFLDYTGKWTTFGGSTSGNTGKSSSSSSSNTTLPKGTISGGGGLTGNFGITNPIGR